MKIKKQYLENEIKKAEAELEYAYALIAERKQYIRILRIIKTKMNEN
jgi:hypothetical protein